VNTLEATLTIEFEGNFAGDDFASVPKVMFRTHLKATGLIGQAIIFFVLVLFIITTAIENLTYDDCGCGTEVGQLKLAALFAIGLSLIRLAMIWSGLRRFWENHCNSLVGVDLRTHYRLDESGYSSQFSEGTYNYSWSRIAGYFRTDRLICLKSKSGMLHMIPTHQLADHDKEAIVSLLSAQGIKEQANA
jgi:hypothetical protein